MRKRLAIILVAGLCLGASAADKQPGFRFRKDIELGQAAGEEIIAVALDSDVYAGTRDGYPDLRIVDDQGTTVPYLLEPIGKKRINRSQGRPAPASWFPFTSTKGRVSRSSSRSMKMPRAPAG